MYFSLFIFVVEFILLNRYLYETRHIRRYEDLDNMRTINNWMFHFIWNACIWLNCWKKEHMRIHLLHKLTAVQWSDTFLYECDFVGVEVFIVSRITNEIIHFDGMLCNYSDCLQILSLSMFYVGHSGAQYMPFFIFILYEQRMKNCRTGPKYTNTCLFCYQKESTWCNRNCCTRMH